MGNQFNQNRNGIGSSLWLSEGPFGKQDLLVARKTLFGGLQNRMAWVANDLTCQR